MDMYKSKHSKRRGGYWRRTWKNKACALIVLAVGTVPVFIDHDATALVFMACFAVPMFFSREDWFL